MSPRFSMRTFQASRFMRVMAVFAWLMLVVVSLPAAAMGTGMDMSQGDMPPTMTMHHGMQHATPAGDHHAGDCCGGPSHAACHCDAMCGSVLIPGMPALSGSTMPAGHYLSFSGIDAPTLDPIPPLRPPAV